MKHPPTAAPDFFDLLWPEQVDIASVLQSTKNEPFDFRLRALLANARHEGADGGGNQWLAWTSPRTGNRWVLTIDHETGSDFGTIAPHRVWESLRDRLERGDQLESSQYEAQTKKLLPTLSNEEWATEVELARRMWRRTQWLTPALRGVPFEKLRTPGLRSSVVEERPFDRFADSPGCVLFWLLATWLVEPDHFEAVATGAARPLALDLVKSLRALDQQPDQTLSGVALAKFRQPLRELLAKARAAAALGAAEEAKKAAVTATARSTLRVLDGARELEAGLGSMPELRRLWLGCVVRLPGDLGQASQLEELTVWDAYLSKLPDDLFRLPRLRRLSVTGAYREGSKRSCTSLGTLPGELGNLRELTELTLNEAGVSKIPTDALGALSKLERVSLTRGDATSDPVTLKAIGGLPQLRFLGLGGAKRVPLELAGAPIETLDLTDFRASLEELVPFLRELPKLRRLTLTSRSEKGLPQGFESLPLQQLVIGFPKLDVPGLFLSLRNMPTLRSLTVFDAAYRKTLEPVAELTQLEELRLLDCRPAAKATVAGLERLTQLTSLEINDWTSDPQLARCTRGLTKLRRLRLTNCRLEAGDDGLSELSELEELNLGINPLTRLPDGVADLPRLRSLTLRQTSAGNWLETANTLSRLRGLHHVDLSATALSRLPAFVAEQPELRSLWLIRNEKLAQDAHTIWELARARPSLRGLWLDGTVQLAQVDEAMRRAVGSVAHLEHLTVGVENAALLDSLRALVPDTRLNSSFEPEGLPPYPKHLPW